MGGYGGLWVVMGGYAHAGGQQLGGLASPQQEGGQPPLSLGTAAAMEAFKGVGAAEC